MKRMFGVVVGLFCFYLIIQVVFSLFISKHSISYTVNVGGTLYNIKELFVSNHQTNNAKDLNSYYYEIRENKKENILFNFKLIGNNYHGIEHYLTDIKIYKDNNIICMYPIFKDKETTLDIICNKNDKQYSYVALADKENGLNSFVSSLTKAGYNNYSWTTPNLKKTNLDRISVYQNNFINNQYIFVWNYKSIYSVNNNSVKKIPLFYEDHYDNNISIIYDHYYYLPNYNNSKNYFNSLIRIDFKDNSIDNYNIINHLSYDSYFQGFIEDKIYIVDRSNKVQYKFNVNNSQLSITGDINSNPPYYHNGKWETKTIYSMIDTVLLFGNDANIPSNLNKYSAYKIDSVLGNTDGFYYLYIKNGNNTDVYRVDKQNKNILTLLFTASNVASIKYVNDQVYFINGDTLYVYSDNLGLRPLLKNNELTFNHTNMYDVYIEQD